MNNVVIQKPATLPAKTGKAFKGLTIESFIGGIYPYADEERATPSLVKMTRHASIAALGGEASPQSLINGMLYVVSAHAFGQLDYTGLKLPAHSSHAVKTACDFVAKGRGATCATVRAAVLSGISSMLALPAKTITVTKKVPALPTPMQHDEANRTYLLKNVMLCNPAMDSDTQHDEANRTYLLEDVMLCNPAMDSDTQQARYSGFYLRQSQARTEARNASPDYRADCDKLTQAEWIANKAEERAISAAMETAIAVAEFKRLAEILHVKLTAAQIKALALAA